MDLIGKKLGECEILSLLGKGGMGEVYKAVHTSLRIKVAVKTIDPMLINQTPVFIERFYREARQVAKINHQNIMRVYNVNEENGIHYIITELIEGPSLREVLKLKGKLKPEVAIPLMIQAFKGLGEAHSFGILHRDLKPDNLLVNTRGILKITDFGLSKSMEQQENIGLTCAGQILGTPAFMPIEQWSGDPIDERSDIYALGVTFFNLLTGELPVVAKNAAETLTKLLTGEIRKIETICPEIPDFICKIINKMLMLNPSQRFSNCNKTLTNLKKTLSFYKVYKIEQAMYAFTRDLIKIQDEKRKGAKTDDFRTFESTSNLMNRSDNESESRVSPGLRYTNQRQSVGATSNNGDQLIENEFFSVQNQKTILTVTPLKMPKFKKSSQFRNVKQINKETAFSVKHAEDKVKNSAEQQEVDSKNNLSSSPRRIRKRTTKQILRRIQNNYNVQTEFKDLITQKAESSSVSNNTFPAPINCINNTEKVAITKFVYVKNVILSIKSMFKKIKVKILRNSLTQYLFRLVQKIFFFISSHKIVFSILALIASILILAMIIETLKR